MPLGNQSEDKAIGKFDESLQRLFVELKVKSSEADWTAIRAELHGNEFFHAGPLVCPSDRPVVCSSGRRIQTKWTWNLKPCCWSYWSAWQLSVPKLGTVTANKHSVCCPHFQRGETHR